jgi:hypothetical protein
MTVMRSFGVRPAPVQKSSTRMEFIPMKWTPLWSKDQVSSPNRPRQASPMSTYQSCSPGMIFIGTLSFDRIFCP